MRNLTSIALMLFGLMTNVGSLQLAAQENPFSFSIKGSLTTDSQIFLNPSSSNPVERAESFFLSNIYGIGAELKYRLPDSYVAIGLSAEYLEKKTAVQVRLNNSPLIPLEDGYMVIPVEMTGYFIVPFSDETFSVYMGGGGGAYFGRRIYSIAGVDAGNVRSEVGYGIHVVGGMTYRILGFLSIVGEMKFRDLQFESSNQFSVDRIQHGDISIGVSRQPFTSRVHTDGIVFQLGIAFNL